MYQGQGHTARSRSNQGQHQIEVIFKERYSYAGGLHLNQMRSCLLCVCRSLVVIGYSLCFVFAGAQLWLVTLCALCFQELGTDWLLTVFCVSRSSSLIGYSLCFVFAGAWWWLTNPCVSCLQELSGDWLLPVFCTFRSSAVIGYSLAVCCAVVNTLDILVVRCYPTQLSDKNLFIALFWTYGLGAIISLIIMTIFEHPQLPTGLRDWGFTCLHMISYIFILPLFMYGASVTSGNTANIINTSSILIMLLAQYTILRNIHPGNRNWIEVLGVLLVLCGSTLSSVVEICRGNEDVNDLSQS